MYCLYFFDSFIINSTIYIILAKKGCAIQRNKQTYILIIQPSMLNPTCCNINKNVFTLPTVQYNVLLLADISKARGYSKTLLWFLDSWCYNIRFWLHELWYILGHSPHNWRTTMHRNVVQAIFHTINMSPCMKNCHHCSPIAGRRSWKVGPIFFLSRTFSMQLERKN